MPNPKKAEVWERWQPDCCHHQEWGLAWGELRAALHSVAIRNGLELLQQGTSNLILIERGKCQGPTQACHISETQHQTLGKMQIMIPAFNAANTKSAKTLRYSFILEIGMHIKCKWIKDLPQVLTPLGEHGKPYLVRQKVKSLLKLLKTDQGFSEVDSQHYLKRRSLELFHVSHH